jgi:hypothetical protein
MIDGSFFRLLISTTIGKRRSGTTHEIYEHSKAAVPEIPLHWFNAYFSMGHLHRSVFFRWKRLGSGKRKRVGLSPRELAA